MAILIDPPRWPAHGTVFGHLVSDQSLDELIAFADVAGLDPRAFDHDHYDVPAHRYGDMVDGGALPVSERELIRRLLASGLRVHAAEKTPPRDVARRAALAAWHQLELPDTLRDDLLARWSEPHRRYHDVRHLAACLEAHTQLGGDRLGAIALWFHDAIYEGRAGSDEEASAELAERQLRGVLSPADVAEVARLVRMTTTHMPYDDRSAIVADADLSVLGQSRGRYEVYARDVRLDYAHVTDAAWRSGRATVLEQFLRRTPIFHTPFGESVWERQARENLAAELTRLSR